MTKGKEKLLGWKKDSFSFANRAEMPEQDCAGFTEQTR